MIKINYFIQRIKYKNELDENVYIFINFIIKQNCNLFYKDIVDKRLYTLDDFIQEIWLEFLIMIKKYNYEFKSYQHFYFFIRLIIKTILLKINKQGGAY